MSVFVIYCCLTNDPKFIGFNNPCLLYYCEDQCTGTQFRTTHEVKVKLTAEARLLLLHGWDWKIHLSHDLIKWLPEGTTVFYSWLCIWRLRFLPHAFLWKSIWMPNMMAGSPKFGCFHKARMCDLASEVTHYCFCCSLLLIWTNPNTPLQHSIDGELKDHIHKWGINSSTVLESCCQKQSKGHNLIRLSWRRQLARQRAARGVSRHPRC